MKPSDWTEKDIALLVDNALAPAVRQSLVRADPPARLSFRHSPGAPVMSTESTKEASPTGTPLLPPKAVPWVALLVGLAATGAAIFPADSVAGKVCTVLVGLGGVLGVASPGLRRKA
jgi:hypothetical protein